MSSDSLSTFADSPDAPAAQAFAIVPFDSAELLAGTKAIYVGTAGDVTLRPLPRPGRRHLSQRSRGCLSDGPRQPHPCHRHEPRTWWVKPDEPHATHAAIAAPVGFDATRHFR
jgi:hypothetical protein